MASEKQAIRAYHAGNLPAQAQPNNEAPNQNTNKNNLLALTDVLPLIMINT